MNPSVARVEQPLWFDCQGSSLLGILHHGAPGARRGVMVVVGGPQYRVGSHRQFVLLARALAAQGIPVFRFDCRGMGDSAGTFPGFDQLHDDIAAAADTFAQAAGLSELVLWGLCDGASASLLYAPHDARVRGLVLLNPWLPAEQADAQVMIRHYYAKRIVSLDFWRKLLSGQFAMGQSARSLLGFVCRARGRPSATVPAGATATQNSNPTTAATAPSLSQRMAMSWRQFSGRVLLVLSGDDTVARSFSLSTASAPEWRGLLTAAAVTTLPLTKANHTFSRREWRDEVAAHTARFVGAMTGSSSIASPSSGTTSAQLS